MKALIVIDYTNDFVEGNLPVGEPAIAIEEKVVDITKQFINHHDYVVMAVDLHDEKDDFHPETSLFPPHNIRNTTGRELYGKLGTLYEDNKESIYYMDKTRYSAFAGTDLEMKLRERGITEVHLIGVCTDICVLHTAVDAYNKGFSITVYEDATASFNAEGHVWALGHFKNSLGATVRKHTE
ncbi:isochorismatase family cysteine hydrolase [Paenibacillus polygoni]|uniref:Isochorismatase family cysteine hydrolase n=1 Tax=Paenibacillus polygoni TaxID=3050112 RepID=A0ABY8XA70_9BACL|nr:isochorismatase family cysteine hydrolase [Paenibacillus polygoni]WIV20859.1 isochorismatase family cysteine hydrolase [Paenibacillus polygoni]